MSNVCNIEHPRRPIIGLILWQLQNTRSTFSNFFIGQSLSWILNIQRLCQYNLTDNSSSGSAVRSKTAKNMQVLQVGSNACKQQTLNVNAAHTVYLNNMTDFYMHVVVYTVLLLTFVNGINLLQMNTCVIECLRFP